jgi:hypothetical protein
VNTPVIFPPGRARLATHPFATGSVPVTITIGMVMVVRYGRGYVSGCSDRSAKRLYENIKPTELHELSVLRLSVCHISKLFNTRCGGVVTMAV